MAQGILIASLLCLCCCFSSCAAYFVGIGSVVQKAEKQCKAKNKTLDYETGTCT